MLSVIHFTHFELCFNKSNRSTPELEGTSNENSQASSSSATDVENNQNDEREGSENNEPLEKSKIKRPPGINASLVLMYAVFFMMFTIGVVHITSCPVCIFIPIYLIVAGLVGALAKFLSKSKNKYLFNVAVGLVVLDIIWNGIGTYFVYKNYQPSYEPDTPDYCNRTTYLLAFWILTFQYTLLGFFILLSACYMLMRGDFKKK
ncbi:hypothetical protein NQ318_008831 [Aromia moschata]|uniref:Uncharacterized protein n=1 Tax=Aromia moschata TaxID=1265417 RepID=A0AAV8ZBC6_9CUCU|nr:hypothetical protein NQ318_008831 [Aromia moschata]